MKCRECVDFETGRKTIRKKLWHKCKVMFVFVSEKEADTIPKWCPKYKKGGGQNDG